MGTITCQWRNSDGKGSLYQSKLNLSVEKNMRCPYCGNVHPDDAKFCPITGQSIKSFPELSIKCPNCRGSVPFDARYCPICGAVITDGFSAGQGAVRAGKLNKGNIRKYAGFTVILIISILAIIFFIGVMPKVNTWQLPAVHQTQTPLLQQAVSSPALLSTKIDLQETPSKAQPTDTILLFTRSSPQPTQPDPTPRPTPLPTMDISCPGAPPIRVEVGNLVRVTTTEGDKLNLRSSPKVTNNIINMMPAGMKLRVIGGPICSDNSTFWQVQMLESTDTGWVREGDFALYYIEPIY